MTKKQAPAASTVLTPAELVQRWGGRVSARTLNRWRLATPRHGPRCIYLGHAVVYRLEDVEAWERSKASEQRYVDEGDPTAESQAPAS